MKRRLLICFWLWCPVFPVFVWQDTTPPQPTAKWPDGVHKPPEFLQSKTTRRAQAGNRTDAVRVPASARPYLFYYYYYYYLLTVFTQLPASARPHLLTVFTQLPASARPHLLTVFTPVSSFCHVGRGPLLTQIPRDNSPRLRLSTPVKEGCLFCLVGFGVLSCCTHTCTTPAKPKTQASRFVSCRLSVSVSVSLSLSLSHAQSGFARFSRCLFTLCRPTDNRSTLATCRPLTPDLHLLNTNHLTWPRTRGGGASEGGKPLEWRGRVQALTAGAHIAPCGGARSGLSANSLRHFCSGTVCVTTDSDKYSIELVEKRRKITHHGFSDGYVVGCWAFGRVGADVFRPSR